MPASSSDVDDGPHRCCTGTIRISKAKMIIPQHIFALTPYARTDVWKLERVTSNNDDGVERPTKNGIVDSNLFGPEKWLNLFDILMRMSYSFIVSVRERKRKNGNRGGPSLGARTNRIIHEVRSPFIIMNRATMVNATATYFVFGVERRREMPLLPKEKFVWNDAHPITHHSICANRRRNPNNGTALFSRW